MDFARAYLSNVCVAKELHRNGLGYALIAKSKMVAEDWGNKFLHPIFIVEFCSASRLCLLSHLSACFHVLDLALHR